MIDDLIDRVMADDRLNANPRVDEAHHYTSIAVLLDAPALAGREQRVEQAETEIDNLRAAFAWSCENSDTELALQLASSLQPLWLRRGRIQEGLAWFNAVLGGENAHDLEVAPAVRARALVDKAMLAVSVFDHGSVEQAEQALAIARELDDPALIAQALTACGSIAGYDADVAQTYLAEAIGLARDLGDGWRLSQILPWQAFAALNAGYPIAARAAAEEGRDLADAIGDRVVSRRCRWCLGMAQMMQGDLVGAVAQFGTVIAEAEADHDVAFRVAGLFNQGQALAFHGDTTAGRAAASAALEEAAELGEFIEGFAYAALAVAALAAGDVAEAADASEAARQRLTARRSRRGPTLGGRCRFGEDGLAPGIGSDDACSRRDCAG